MKRIAALFFAIAFVFVACDDDDNDKHEQFFYPMQPGTIWYYTTTQINDYDTAQVTIGGGHITVRVADPDTAGGVGQPTRFDVAVDFLDFEATGSWWYFPTPTALHLVATCGAGSLTPQPKQNSGINNAARNLPPFALPDMLAITGCDGQPVDSHPDRPPVFLYPWRVGQSWVFRTITDIPFTIEKQVSKYAKVTVPAGTYGAYHVVWSWSNSNTLHVEDDIANIGLVRRLVVADSLEETTYEFPFEKVYYTGIQETVLDSVKLP